MISLRELEEKVYRLERLVEQLQKDVAAAVKRPSSREISRESERGYTHCGQCGGNYYRCGCR